MIYTPLTNKAMKLAYRAHHGQTDKCGQPYIFHPYHLAEQMKEESHSMRRATSRCSGGHPGDDRTAKAGISKKKSSKCCVF